MVLTSFLRARRWFIQFNGVGAGGGIRTPVEVVISPELSPAKLPPLSWRFVHCDFQMPTAIYSYYLTYRCD